MKKFIYDLQLFADGAGVAGEGSTGQTTGENVQAAAEATGENVQAAADERAKAYAKARADFKREFDSEIQNAIKERLRKAKQKEKEANEYREKTAKIFDALSVKYGIKSENIDDILKKLDEDNSFYEEEALSRGMSVEDFRQLKEIERENARYKAEKSAEERQQREREWYATLARQAEETKKTYPDFDMETEAKNNRDFVRLIEKGVDVKTAYSVTHQDDIIAAAMKFGAETTAQKMRNTSAVNAERPIENALNISNPADSKVDISKLNKKQIEDYIERARRGEKITFT